MGHIIVTDQKILTQISEPVLTTTERDEIYIKLVEAIKEINKRENCLGLAAPQIGIMRRVFIFNHSDGYELFVNPVLKKVGPKKASDTELCFSIPGKEFTVLRPTKITTKDEIHGKLVLRGFAARVWLHEYDHLEGKTLLQTGIELKNE
jgi:peptide deformylase